MSANAVTRPLGFYPTPLTFLPRLTTALGGPRIWMKRDDQTGLAFGGNKTRKLEHLIRDALAAGADTVITAGAQQSNHCRQTAAACASYGLKCHLVLGGTEPESPSGNYLLDTILGAEVHFTGDERKGEAIPLIAEQLQRQGLRPYLIPYGGSNAVGAGGFVDAAAELKVQLENLGESVDRIIFASSSGGTHAGLLVGCRIEEIQAEIHGIAIDKGEAGEKPFTAHVCDLANETARRFHADADFTESQVLLSSNYTGEGYGVVGTLEREAIRLTAETEGVILDPVYTGRAMGALIDLIRTGRVGKNESVLFWHTGGAPAVFSHAAEILAD